jgi:putative membrane protein
VSDSAQDSQARRHPDDVTRRTHLANERTYLAWWRTGLGCLAAGVGVGRVIPVLTDVTRWPYVVLGAGFSMMGVVCLGYAMIRHRQVDRALERGEWVAPDSRVIVGLAAGGVVLGIFVLLLVLLQG